MHSKKLAKVEGVPTVHKSLITCIQLQADTQLDGGNINPRGLESYIWPKLLREVNRTDWIGKLSTVGMWVSFTEVNKNALKSSANNVEASG